MQQQRCLGLGASPDDATKSEVTGGSVDLFGVPCRRPVATAIVRRAQIRSALDDSSRESDVGLAGVEASVLTATARIFRNTAGLRRVGLMIRSIPVRGPFP